ncbi:permease for cytosine/purines, uracil, thiamine, allantoin-domain-containing protein [Desarmillaria tabescens]|uniref:Permease for cytosine/purines, uracil, thiamine, allantoin-domain-containing protein n=1 Tax=Armillaria tabescens TaxID=1929756 RepID=A0AA39JT29_ARMTA|nr:permease for cytosine/purines, uracil, thiamine, allantoin-domain-containing protein [Desarmillaria tabescens]KAK0446053.1 permease for cytosine/purines, uracil, thiamine, allantoin-domain-containing protein [Desarmillaria tabescens]
MDPTPPEDRTWDTWDYFAYWICDAFSISIWEQGSSMVAVGLNWKLSIVCVSIGFFIMGIIISINGVIGARLRIPFPLIIRSSFGIFFSWITVISRCILAIFWLGVGAVTGGQSMQQLINAIWPSFWNVPDHLPDNIGMTTAGTHIRWFFRFKSIIAPVVMIAIMGTTVHSADVSAGDTPLLTDANPLHGSLLAWSFLANHNSCLGSYAMLGVNIPDFSRYSKSLRTQWWQAFHILAIFTVVTILGIMTAAVSEPLYEEIVDNWRSPRGRAGAAFVSIGLAIAQIGMNVSANSISAANDLVSIFPKYINIRRGQIIAAFISCWAFVPWEILAKVCHSPPFRLGPISAMMMADYYIIKGRKLSVPQLYDPKGIYSYGNVYGINWRAALAMFIGFVPPLPGLINTINTTIPVSTGAIHLFDIGYLYSFFMAGTIYVILSKVFPAKETLCEMDFGERHDHESSHSDEKAEA